MPKLLNQSSSKLIATLNNDLNNLPENKLCKPKPFLNDSAVENKTFTDFDRFQKRLSPTASKSDFHKFLDKITHEKRLYDSNMSSTLQHQKKVLAARQRELSNRTLALSQSGSQDGFEQINLSTTLKNEMKKTDSNFAFTG